MAEFDENEAWGFLGQQGKLPPSSYPRSFWEPSWIHHVVRREKVQVRSRTLVGELGRELLLWDACSQLGWSVGGSGRLRCGVGVLQIPQARVCSNLREGQMDRLSRVPSSTSPVPWLFLVLWLEAHLAAWEEGGLSLSSRTHVLNNVQHDGLPLSSQHMGGRNRRVPGAHRQPT